MSAKPTLMTSDWLAEVRRRVDPQRDSNRPIGTRWPEALPQEAFHGLAGEIISILEPHSEADPVALLTHLLVSFGSIVGRGPHFVVGGTVHHANL
jgi:hypothetical protein